MSQLSVLHADRISRLADKGRAQVSGSLLFGVPLDYENVEHVLAALAVQTALLEDRIRMLQGLNEIERLAVLRSRRNGRSILSRILGARNGDNVCTGGAGEESRTLRAVQSIANGVSGVLDDK